MPYFGKTKTYLDDHGPSSSSVYYPRETEPVCIALNFDGVFIFLHNGELKVTEGTIAFLNHVERLQESLGFSKGETEIWEALTAWNIEQEILQSS